MGDLQSLMAAKCATNKLGGRAIVASFSMSSFENEQTFGGETISHMRPMTVLTHSAAVPAPSANVCSGPIADQIIWAEAGLLVSPFTNVSYADVAEI